MFSNTFINENESKGAVKIFCATDNILNSCLFLHLDNIDFFSFQAISF